MKIKKILSLGIVCLCLVSGCQSQTEKSLKEDNIENEMQISENSFPNVNYNGTYYKVQIEPESYDENKILKYLVPEFAQNEVMENETQEGMEKRVKINDIEYVWSVGKNTFMYFNDTNDNANMTEDEARAIGNDFVQKLDVDIANDSIIKKEDGVYIIEYSIQYKNVKILGNNSIDLGITETESEDGFAYGEYISVTINDSGIKSVFLSNICNVTKVLEEYSGENDFISKNELYNAIGVYFSEYYKNFGKDINGSFTANKITLIYIPYKEEGMEVLEPAFQVEGISTVDGEEYEYDMFIDAVSGYVIDME